MQTIFARKIGMTGKFTVGGDRVGVTKLLVLPMKVVDMRTKEKHGYEAIRFRVQEAGSRRQGKAKEVRTEEKMEPGTKIKLEEVLKAGDRVKVTGVSKGKGFAGVVKRYGFAGGPRTHGQSDRERAPGSSGSTTTPGRVYKGKRRAGRMGGARTTLKGLSVLGVDAEAGIVSVIGSVPGAKTGWVEVTKI